MLPRLAWLLGIPSLPLSWIQSHLDKVVTRYLKKWVGLAHCATVSRLFLDTNRGGFHLPQPSVFFQSLQSSCLYDLPSQMMFVSELWLSQKSVTKHSRHPLNLPGAFLAEHSLTSGSLKNSLKFIKKQTSEINCQNLFRHLSSLSVQGASARCEDLEAAQWSISVKHLPDNLFKWAFNAKRLFQLL